MNWHTDWERAQVIVAWDDDDSEWIQPPFVRKTFAIRSAALALLAFTVQWGLFDAALRML